MNTSNYNELDYLSNLRAEKEALATMGTAQKQTKFGSVINDINKFLGTATDTAKTFDGIINGSGNGGGSEGNQLSPEQRMAMIQAQREAGKSKSMMMIGGAVVVGGGVLYMLTRKKGK